MFKCHLNVESCASVKAIQYICKYVFKGSDLATASVKDNEIEMYLNGRYISTCEAFWRLFEYPIHERYPAVSKFLSSVKLFQLINYNECDIYCFRLYILLFIWKMDRECISIRRMLLSKLQIQKILL